MANTNSSQFYRLKSVPLWAKLHWKFLIILLIAIGLYYFQIDTEPLWYDEFFTIDGIETRESLPPTNAVRPFYFVIVYGWMLFGQNVIWLRTLSILFALASIALIYLLGKKLANETIGLSAATLLTLSPLMINHAQEVRMYTLIVSLSLGGTLALVQALEKPNGIIINAWAITRLCLLFTTPLCTLLLITDTCVIACKFLRERRVLFLFGLRLLFIGAVWSPFFLEVKQASNEYLNAWSTSYPKPNPILIVAEVTHLTAFWPIRHLLGSGISANDLMAEMNQRPLLNVLFEQAFSSDMRTLAFYMVYTAIAASVLGFALFIQRNSAKIWWLKLWAFLPTLSILTISYVSSSIWRARYLLIASPYWLILLSIGVFEIWRWKRWLGAVLIVLYAIAVTGGLVHYYSTIYRVFDGAPT